MNEPQRACSPEEAAALLDDLKRQYQRLNDSDQVELMYILCAAHHSY